MAEIKDQEGVFSLIFDNDDLSWQSILHELVRTNQMDPWDIDVSVLTHNYLQMVTKLKKMDFRITGKVVLAAALLLKMKSNRLLGEDLDQLDSLFAQKDQLDLSMEDYFEDSAEFKEALDKLSKQHYKLIPRTPQARKRKVSIYDLIGALQKAMEVKKRRVMRELPPIEFKAPEKSRDISDIIREVYSRIKSYFFKNKDKLTFSKLIPSESKEDKVYTFIPLLHLTNSRKIDLLQEQHFGEIEIELLRKANKEDINKELGVENG